MQKATATRGLRFLPKLTFVVTIGLICVAAAYTASAIDVFTEAVGFYNLACTNNSDTMLTDPFLQIPAFKGTVASASGSAIVVNGPQTWAPTTQWATPTTPNGYYPYYVQVTSGTYEGAYYTITNNDASTLYVGFVSNGAASDQNLSGINPGDYIRIVAFWQLNTVWPNGSGIVPSTGSSVGTRRTQVLFPSLVQNNGTLVSAAATYYYYNNAWRQAGKNAASNYNDVVVIPDQFVIVRQATNATDSTTTVGIGLVDTNKARFPLFAITGGQQDNYVAIYRPSVQTLLQTGLTNPAFVASTGSSVGTRQDQLLVYDNTAQSTPKSAANTYYFYNNGWRLAGKAASIDFSTSNTLQIAGGILIRKQTNTTAVSTWVNPPNY